MNIISALLLTLSATLASVRNVLTRGFASFSYKKREFFGIQALIFGAGSIMLLIVNLFSFKGLSAYTFFLALVYGMLLVCAQWFYTIALSNGKIALCATIYSFGFLIPTLSGAIFWDESITVLGAVGILVAMSVLLLSGLGKKAEAKKASISYFPPLILAMICSGGLGVVQKIHQGSVYSSQLNSFILVAFVFCFVVSSLFFLFLKKGPNNIQKKNFAACSVIGVFFAFCNLLNTYLAGKLNSSVFFPAINIASILFSLVFSLIIYKEKPTKKDLIVLCLSIASIVLVNF